MNVTVETSPSIRTHGADKAITLALRLSHAENELHAFTAGQVDAVVAPDGKAYLLHAAQESLRQDVKRLKAMIDRDGDVVTVVNRGGIILSQSQAVSRVLGYEPEELVGSCIFDLVHHDDLSAVYFPFIEVIEGFHENDTVHFRHRNRDGSYRTILATVTKLHDIVPENVVFSLRPIAGGLPAS